MNTELEKEIQARVEFKMNELLTGVKNVASINWGLAASNSSQKHTYYWEAFEQMKKMLIKELEMATPFDEMDKHNKDKARDKSVKIIVDRLKPILRGRINVNEEYSITSTIVSAIEQAQNY